MSKFHVNNDGNIAKCRAVKGNCPFGEDMHFDSVEQAQKGYEKQMNDNLVVALKKPETINTEKIPYNMIESLPLLPKDTFITVDNPDNVHDLPIAESFAENLGDDLIPGQYKGFYYDEDNDVDKQVIVTVNSDGSSFAQPYSDAVWNGIQNNVGETLGEKKKREVIELTETLSELKNDKKFDSGNINDINYALNNIVGRHDFTSKSGSQSGLEELIEFQDDLNYIGHLLEIHGTPEEALSYKVASEKLSDIIVDLNEKEIN